MKHLPLSFLSIFLFISCTSEHKNTKVLKLPSTVNEVSKLLLNELSEDNLNQIADSPEDQLIQFHHGLGTAIRNKFNLWGNNLLLLRDTGKRHPDDASMVIIEALWKEIHLKRLRNSKNLFKGFISKAVYTLDDKSELDQKRFEERRQDLKYLTHLQSEISGMLEDPFGFDESKLIKKIKKDISQPATQIYTYIENAIQYQHFNNCLVEANLEVIDPLKTNLKKGQKTTVKFNFSTYHEGMSLKQRIVNLQEYIFSINSDGSFYVIPNSIFEFYTKKL